MLQVAIERGIRVVQARVVDLEFHERGVLVYSENEPVECDVVVGAFGLDEGGAALFSRATGYRPPSALSSVVTKYHPGEEMVASFGPCIHAFLPRDAQIEFAGITPKGNHLTINIAGKHVDATRMDEFIRRPNVAAHLPKLESAGAIDAADLRYFKGRFPCSIAHRYYGDRYVMIGDASGLVRSFKGKGITSAVQTGIRAAETIFHYGYSEGAFRDHFRRENQDLLSDLPYGQLMRWITIWLSRTGLLDAVIRAGGMEPSVSSALAGAVSGVMPYREVMLRMIKPGSLKAVIANIPRHPSRVPLE
jgi:flavin-dependent dehydrogenase